MIEMERIGARNVDRFILGRSVRWNESGWITSNKGRGKKSIKLDDKRSERKFNIKKLECGGTTDGISLGSAIVDINACTDKGKYG